MSQENSVERDEAMSGQHDGSLVATITGRAARRARHHTLLAVASIAALACVGCGSTYVDTTATNTTVDAAKTTPTTQPPASSIDPDTPLPELLDQLDASLSGLSNQIVERQDPQATLDRIDALWAVIAPQLPDATAAFQYGQVIDLATSAVRAKRPADADKALSLLRSLRA